MVSTFTPNIQLEEPARGDDVGTWDTPTNANMTLVDLVVGGIVTIGLNNSNVVLSAGQLRSKLITFNSTLTGSVTVTFPTSFIKSYEIQNLCTGSSAFTITLETTATGGQVICCPYGEIVDVVNDGANLKFKGLGRVGSYWDYAGSSVPNWVSGCTVQPYLNCDGTTFSSATFPALAMVLGSTTLPNSQGKYRLTLNQSASTPVSSGTNGLFTASSVGVVGGAQATTLSSQHLPKLVDPSHTHTYGQPNVAAFANTGSGGDTFNTFNTVNTGAATTGITYGSSTQIVVPSLPPTYVGGLTLIRAA